MRSGVACNDVERLEFFRAWAVRAKNLREIGASAGRDAGTTLALSRGMVVEPGAACRFVVLTGGPGAGKTAVLETVKREFSANVTILPESAGILYGGGFPRRSAGPARRAAQRCIYHVQRELERLVVEEGQSSVVLCDRGTLDGLAYWPGTADELWHDVGTTQAAELARYSTVIHLRTPEEGYNNANPMRIETVAEARRIDELIERAWTGHPRRFFVESTRDFMDKMVRAIALVRAELTGGPPLGETLPREGSALRA
jgi:predicted ATPase